MIQYTPAQYKDILRKLPQEIRDVVLSSETTEHLWKIGEKHNLQIDKVGIMHDMTMDTMMGIIPTKDFVIELVKNLEISVLEASTLARDIDENVFKPIKQTMTALYANGAPNRPSSSLVKYYDEDEDHPSLNKDELLKGIEDPAPAEVKKEVTTTTESLVAKKLSSLEENKTAIKTEAKNPTIAIEKYHEEIQNNTSLEGHKLSSLVALDNTAKQNQIQKNENLADPSKLLSSQASKLQSSDLLNKIAGIKLSKTFVMPKPGGEAQDLKSLGGDKLGITDSNSRQATNPGNLGENKSPINLGVTNSNPIKPEAINKTETPKPASATIDPYREKI